MSIYIYIYIYDVHLKLNLLARYLIYLIAKFGSELLICGRPAVHWVINKVHGHREPLFLRNDEFRESACASTSSFS